MRLLGRYEIFTDGERVTPPATAKARSMFAYLALRAGEPIRRETLMNVFWPDADPTSARNNLKTTLSSIRRTFRDHGDDPDAILDITRDTVRLMAPTVVDSREFVARSSDVDSERAQAIALYSGEFAPGDANEWAIEQREVCAARLEALLRADIAAHPARANAERLLTLDPFCDEAYVVLIDDALAGGNRRAAQAIYRRYAAALAEIGAEPPRDVSIRAGMHRAGEPAGTFPFCGRSDELAEAQRLATEGARTLIVTGPQGIGKRAFAAELRSRVPELDVVCALEAEDSAAPAIELGPLAYDEVAIALRRRAPTMSAETIQAFWRRTHGHPLVLRALVAQFDSLEAADAQSVERARLPRDAEREFDAQLRSLGSDAAEAALLLALESRLDDDDLAALLEWSTARVLAAREVFARCGVALPYIFEAALRAKSSARRAHEMQRIVQRLKLHEDPDARVDAATLLVRLGRRSEAARAYFEAAQGYAEALALENAVRTIDAALDALAPVPPSRERDDLVRNLQGLRGRSLYQQGSFLPATHALQEVLDVSPGDEHAELRARTLTLMGHALVRLDLVEPVRVIALHACEEAARANAAGAEVAAQHLMARVLRDRLEYDECAVHASRTYERAIARQDWPIASNCASLVIEVSRRSLRIGEAFAWAPRQLDAGILAGPVLEAEARHMFGSVKAVVHDLDGALEEFRHGLALLDLYRRRRGVSATPVGQLEWMLHYAIAHTLVRSGTIAAAIEESEWMLRSPWMRNSPMSLWQGVSLIVDARLASGSPGDLDAVASFIRRFPPLRSPDRRAVLDRVARARAAAALDAPDAVEALREALDQLTEAAPLYADQVAPYFFRLAESAHDLDGLIAERAAATGRRFERTLAEAAGILWKGPRPAR